MTVNQMVQDGASRGRSGLLPSPAAISVHIGQCFLATVQTTLPE